MMADKPHVSLEQLLLQDGIHLEGDGAEKKTICWNPHHNDTEPSMWVNVVKGTFFCQSCHIGGNAYQYLTRFRGLTSAQAMKILGDAGWTKERRDQSVEQDHERARKRSGQPKSCDVPYTEIRGKRMIAKHEYRDADGNLVVLLHRWPTGCKPKIVPFTPRERGGWWVKWAHSDQLPKHDRRVPLPLYRLPELLAAKARDPERQVWIVEGEKCVDAVLGLPAEDLPKGPPPCTTLPGGSNPKISQIDLSPLYGSMVALISDGDAVGRDYMQRLGAFLNKNGCGVKILKVPGTKGYDIADVIAEGGIKAVGQWITELGGPQPYSEVKDIEQRTPNTIQPVLSDTDFFRVLGLSGDNVVIQKKDNYEIMLIPRRSLHQEGILISIAPLTWWYDEGGDFKPATRLSFADSIIRAAEKAGMFDSATRLIGRGAYLQDDQFIYNLGDQLLLESENGTLSDTHDLSDVPTMFTPGPAIHMVNANGADPVIAKEFYDSVLAYRWMDDSSARAFVGWLVSSIVGGALRHRPMLWLLAPARTGKTWLLDNVVHRLLGQMVIDTVDTTEAGLMSAVKGDSLPVYHDEFEPSRNTMERWKGVLAMVRAASTGAAARLRGAYSGGSATQYRPRFSMMVASIRRPRLSTADESRFFPTYLSSTEVVDWPTVRDQILGALGKDRAAKLRSHIIRHTPKIVRRAYDFEDHLVTVSGHDTREAQVLAALMAGAEFLSDDGSPIHRRHRMSDDNMAILSSLLGHQVRTDANDMRTISEVLHRGYYGLDQRPPSESHRNLASRFGFRLEKAVSNREYELLVAPGSQGMVDICKRTDFESVDMEQYFLSLPGATKGGGRRADGVRYQRKKFGNMLKSYVVIPAQVLAEVGFFNDSLDVPDDYGDYVSTAPADEPPPPEEEERPFG